MLIKKFHAAGVTALVLTGCFSVTEPSWNSPTIVDHTNWDASNLSGGTITDIQSLDTFFQHASVGSNVCDGLDALAQEAGSPFNINRVGVTDYTVSADTPSFDSAWYDSNSGLRDVSRGNPGAAEKIDMFRRALDGQTLATKIDAATFKFCYIDNPADTQAAQDLFDSVKTVMEALEADYPQTAFIWWTMPIETSADQPRQHYNDLVRAYCTANTKWLLDIADIESHTPEGTLISTGGIELLYDDYTDDGGHLNAGGQRRLALAWWQMMALIAHPGI